MTTRTVTGNVKTLTDSAVQTGTVTFNLKGTYATGSTLHQSGSTTATTDSSGDFSVALAVPASGSYLYEMVLPNNAPFEFYLSSGSSVNVATLIQAQSITVADDVEDMLAAYLPLAGGTMTGNLAFSGSQTVDGVDVSALDTTVSSLSTSVSTHTALTTTAHGGLLPQDAAIISKTEAYQLAAGDEGKVIECNGTFTVTCPNGLDTGFQVVIVNVGSGTITIAAATTLTTKDSAVTLPNQYGAATVYHAGSGTWRAFGDLS